jgi:hypothetical protein
MTGPKRGRVTLTSRRRPLLHALFNGYTAVAPIVLIFIIALLRPPPWPANAAIPYLLLMGVIVVVTIINHPGGFSRISFMAQHDEQSFWKANKDKVYLLIIGAIIGGILAKLIPFLLSKFGL